MGVPADLRCFDIAATARVHNPGVGYPKGRGPQATPF